MIRGNLRKLVRIDRLLNLAFPRFTFPRERGSRKVHPSKTPAQSVAFIHLFNKPQKDLHWLSNMLYGALES